MSLTVNVELIFLTVIVAFSLTELWFLSGIVVTVNVYFPASNTGISIVNPSTLTSWSLILAVIPLAPVVSAVMFMEFP